VTFFDYIRNAPRRSTDRRLWGATAQKATDVVHLGPDKIRLTRLAIAPHEGQPATAIGRRACDLLRFGATRISWETPMPTKPIRMWGG
jgi:hypothetical protein